MTATTRAVAHRWTLISCPASIAPAIAHAAMTTVTSSWRRYYLLANRPENQDTIFLWSDFIARNNNELLANLGNFSNRALKFTKAAFAGAVPAYPGE